MGEQEADDLRQALEGSDAEAMLGLLPKRVHHRIAGVLAHRAIYLDIETTGVWGPEDIVTLVGWSVAGEYRCLIHGGSTDELFDALGSSPVIVTFNGSSFDLPVLRLHMPCIPIPKVHLDLRYLARRCDLTGGQKAIEARLGLVRQDGVQGLAGDAAPWLWQRYRAGDRKALQRLIDYNRADVEGMEVIAAHCLRDRADADGIDVGDWPGWLRSDPLAAFRGQDREPCGA
jgi:uncharacterized protein YprB with RNaseH-like and TPR domain